MSLLTTQDAATVAMHAARHMERAQDMAAVYARMQMRTLDLDGAPSPFLMSSWREFNQLSREWSLTLREANTAYRAAVWGPR